MVTNNMVPREEEIIENQSALEIILKYIKYHCVLIVFSGYSKLTVPNTMMCAGYKEGEKIHARLDGELCSIRIDKNKELT